MSWRDWFSRSDPIEEELASHLRMAIEERIVRGESPADAERNARRELGNLTHVSEVTREQRRGWRMLLDELAQDARYARRQLTASPGFSAATLITLSLGIGVTTILYSINVVNTAPVPDFRDVGRIVHVAQGTGGNCLACFRMTAGNFLTVRDGARSLTDAALFGRWQPVFRAPDRTVVIDGALVTPALFRALGVPAMLGRTLIDADTMSSEPDVMVLNETLWRTYFGADSGIVGRTVVVDATPRVVVGIVGTSLAFPRTAMLWAPRRFTAADHADRGWTNDEVVARLAPGVTLAQARAELATIAARLQVEFPEAMKDWTFDAMPLADWYQPRSGTQFLTMSTAVALVLAIACINLAGLLIARLASRRKEIAVRAAMGAGTARIVRQLLTESLLLAAISGVLGAALASGALQAIGAAIPPSIAAQLPNWSALGVDLRGLGFSVGSALLTGIAIGIWPALRFARPSLVGELKDGARQASSAPGVSRFRRGLVVAEVACAIVLMAGAGLLARTLVHLYTIQPGFRTDHLLTMRVYGPPRAPKDSTPIDSARFERLVTHLEHVHGVVRAATVVGLPFSNNASTNGFEIELASGEVAKVPTARMLPVTAGYFATMELPILRGRAFTLADRSGAELVAIIDSTLAARFFKDAEPLGAWIRVSGERRRIVGVARDAYYGNVLFNRNSTFEVYRPIQQWPWRWTQLAIRTSGDPAQMTHSVERAIRAFDADLGTRLAAPMEQLMHEDTAASRLMAAMMTGFALCAMLISVIGLYSVISYNVAQRTREFGIRRALGAGRRSLVALVLSQGAMLTGLGAIVGLAGALAVTRAMGSLVVGIVPGDPVTVFAMAVLMCLVGLAAAYVPARRASRVDPIISLRDE